MKRELKGLVLREYKENLVLDSTQKETLFGALLGDASIPRRYENIKIKTPFIKVEQSIKNKLYVEHLYDLLKDWTGTTPYIRTIRGGGAKERVSIGFRTYSHPQFESFYRNFYDQNTGEKIVPVNLSSLSSRSLAYWYMDDGSYIKSNNNYYINSQGFSLEDNIRLQEALANMEVVTSIQRDRTFYRLYIKSQSVDNFVDMVKPYILKCFHAKFHPKYFTLT